MANPYKERVLHLLQQKYGTIKSLPKTQSLFVVESLNIVLYFRYSKVFQHGKNGYKTFYGLRFEDLQFLQGKQAYIIFLSDMNNKSLVMPFSHIEHILTETTPSSDSQYKTLIFFKNTGTEIYIPQFVKFNAESYLGLESLLEFKNKNLIVPEISHTQAQIFIGAIGIYKGFDIFYPASDRIKIDLDIIDKRKMRNNLPYFHKDVQHIMEEIDCIWLDSTKIISLFEIEHSTPIYSGLLRFNDVNLTIANVNNFNIIANSERENKFHKEINRPTFKQNNLIEKVSFMTYSNLYYWYMNFKNTGVKHDILSKL